MRLWEDRDSDGVSSYPAREYAESVTGLWPKLLSSAKSLAGSKHLSHSRPESGHRLTDEFSDLYEMKVGKKHRFIAFLRFATYYVISGFPKDPSRKKQARDYRTAKAAVAIAKQSL